MMPGAARLKRLLRKSEKRGPHGLKSVRRIKKKRLNGTAEGVPFQNTAKTDFFSSLQSCALSNHIYETI